MGMSVCMCWRDYPNGIEQQYQTHRQTERQTNKQRVTLHAVDNTNAHMHTERERGRERFNAANPKIVWDTEISSNWRFQCDSVGTHVVVPIYTFYDQFFLTTHTHTQLTHTNCWMRCFCRRDRKSEIKKNDVSIHFTYGVTRDADTKQLLTTVAIFD